MTYLQKLWNQIRISLKTFGRAFWHEYYPALFMVIFFSVLFVLQWLFEYEQFYHIVIVNEAGLSLLQIVDVLLDSLVSLFKYPDDLTPVSLILIAFFQSAIMLIWIRSKRAEKAHKASLGALGIGLLGAGCVACAGSLLGVLLTAFGAVLSVALVQTIGDVLLIMAVVLSTKAFVDIGVKTARYIK